MKPSSIPLQRAGQIAFAGLAFGVSACGGEAPEAASETIAVSITVCADACRTIDAVSAPRGGAVIDAMAAARAAGRLDADWRGDGAMAFVTSIDGITAPVGDRYWLFWVDGAYACVGPGSHAIDDGAQIEWRLTSEGGSCS
ncbi:MAG: DUF4430 domain-containing protein [Pseudomonadota bacterium]